MKKDVIYIDVEDDITGIIDKVKASSAKIVALVPPKRSNVLQSVVNMKLLKRATEESSKKPVLITNERSLLPLAGGVGLYVAKNLQSKPYIPDAPEFSPETAESVIEEPPEPDIEKDKSVGELDDAHKTGQISTGPKGAKKEKPVSDKSGGKTGKSKKKIPSFDKFRTKLLIGIGIVLLLAIGWFVAFWVLPKATIAIKAQTTRIEIKDSFTADSGTDSTNVDEGVLKAEEKQLTKTASETFKATGEKNIGNKASGTITVQNCDSSSSITVPGGTMFSFGGLNFVSAQAVTVPGGSFSGGTCSSPGEESVSVTADQPGDQYNLSSGTEYSLSGQSGFVTGYGGQMSGGTTQIAKVITASDIDAAKAKLSAQNHNSVIEELAGNFDEDEMYVLTQTLTVAGGEPSVTPPVDTQANEGTATAELTYTMLAVSKKDFNQWLDKHAKDQIDEGKQEIYQNGFDNAKLSVARQQSNTKFVFDVDANAFVGPQFDEEAIAKEVSGKRFSDIVSTIKDRPGVNSVDVKLSPFWVNKAPRSSRIHIEFDVSDHTLQ